MWHIPSYILDVAFVLPLIICVVRPPFADISVHGNRRQNHCTCCSMCNVSACDFYGRRFFVWDGRCPTQSVIEKKKCYQCEVKDLSLCTDEYLLPCPENQAYDNCMTRISKTKSDGAWIHKSCALGPCSLRDESQSSGLGLDHCDRSKEEYDCISCCREDGCNTGSGAICTPATILFLLLGFLLPFMKK